MDLREARHAVTGIAADGIGLYGKMMSWIFLAWGAPAELVVGLVRGNVTLALVGATMNGAFGLFGWWICNGIVRRRKVRVVLAALGSLTLGAVTLATMFTWRVSENHGRPFTGLGAGLLLTIAGVLLLAEAFTRRDAP